EVVERLFSPFFSTKAEGMGIGLNICRTAVEFHGGTLTHADNPAGGTIFRFSVPALTETVSGPETINKEPIEADQYSGKPATPSHFSL
ncbi:MAG: two-component system, LuxR family, sensor histidine kinase DctS, partial [Burkholderiales bacterium]